VRSRAEQTCSGASKASIGHLEGTSGIAGIVKAILVLEKGIIPPIATLENLNPAIDASFLNLEVSTTSLPLLFHCPFLLTIEVPQNIPAVAHRGSSAGVC
jgi:acyl transferase domain-containing protein